MSETKTVTLLDVTATIEFEMCGNLRDFLERFKHKGSPELLLEIWAFANAQWREGYKQGKMIPILKTIKPKK